MNIVKMKNIFSFFPHAHKVGISWWSLGVFILFIISCNKSKIYAPSQNALFLLLDSTQCGINFINKVTDTEEMNIFSYRNFYNGGGVGIGDINNDGLQDIYFTSNQEKNKLYLNKGNMQFEDISKKSGTEGIHSWSTGVTMVDINNDNLMDIYVCNAGNTPGDNRKNELFINQGNLTFKEEAAKYGLDEEGLTTQASFFDYDHDGDLDCYILNNSYIPVSALAYENKREIKAKDWNVPEAYRGGGDKLLKNENGKFVDVTESAGIYESLQGFGLGVTTGDVNGDNWVDIYVSNDFFERDYLYINQKDGTFKDEFEERIKHSSISSMGADMQDINNDGKLDVFVTEMLPEDDTRLKQTTNFETYDVTNLKQSNGFYNQYMQNTLQLNQGNGSFNDIAYYAGVAASDWSWGALIFDMNNDGYNDIYVSNGIYHDLTDNDFMDFFANDIVRNMAVNDIKSSIDSIINQMPSTPIPNYAFINNKNLTFTNQACEIGLGYDSFSNGAAYADLDNDGDMDLVVNNVNMPCMVYRNQSREIDKTDYLKIKFKGESQNINGIGASVCLYSKGIIQKQENYPSRGFQSSIDYNLHFGLIKNRKIDSLVVIWPNNQKQTLKNIKPNQLLALDIKNANETFIYKEQKPLHLYMTEVDNNLMPHRENVYTDFDAEGLIPAMLSAEGPTTASGDVNGDGTEDLFIGGSLGQAGQIYLNKNGAWTPMSNPNIEADKQYEDTASLLADIDKDGDLDLIVGSGGNALPDGNQYYSDRLYLNDGKGNFSKANYHFNSVKSNTSVIVNIDYDKDGDEDLFIGNRVVGKTYGAKTKNILLENNGKGGFKEVTSSKAPDIRDLGMITSAKVQDINNDKKPDLIVVGEWMEPVVLISTGKGLVKQNTGMENLSGWWSTVAAKDLDHDGDIDLVLGNKGQNHIYTANKEKPAMMFVNDYDKNGTTEAIFTHYVGEENKPIHSRREIAGQLPSLKKENLKFSEYAKKSFDDLFTNEQVSGMGQYSIKENRTVIALNNGKGQFTVKSLPMQSQLSAVKTIEVLDINKDGIQDIIIAGNNYNLKPQFSRDDSFSGDIFLGNKNGNYTWVPPYISGFQYNGQARYMKVITVNDKKYLILGLNNASPKMFKIN